MGCAVRPEVPQPRFPANAQGHLFRIRRGSKVGFDRRRRVVPVAPTYDEFSGNSKANSRQ